MDALWLPVLTRNDTLDNALAAMSSAGLSAIMLEQDDAWVGAS